MKILVTFFVILQCCGIVISDVSFSTDPSGAAFPIEGSDFVLECTGIGDSSAPDLFFQNNKSEIKNSTADNRTVVTLTKNEATKTSVLTLFIRKITLTDIPKPIVYCDTESSGFQISVFIVPEASVPVFKGGNFKQISKQRGGDVEAVCTVDIQVTRRVEKVTIEWRFKHLQNDSSLEKNVKTKKIASNDSHVESQLTITGLQNKNAGRYFCLAVLWTTDKSLTNVDKNLFVKTFELTEIIHSHNEGGKELIVKAGETARLDCPLNGVPFPRLVWSVHGEELNTSTDSRYKYSEQTSQDPYARYLTINDVTYTDRAKYTCTAYFNNTNFSMDVTLRVRDPLGALWPVVGMVIEAILLALVILVCELCKGKRLKKNDLMYSNQETSPLVSNTPAKVSYKTGEETVRTGKVASA